MRGTFLLDLLSFKELSIIRLQHALVTHLVFCTLNLITNNKILFEDHVPEIGQVLEDC